MLFVIGSAAAVGCASDTREANTKEPARATGGVGGTGAVNGGSGGSMANGGAGQSAGGTTGGSSGGALDAGDCCAKARPYNEAGNCLGPEAVLYCFQCAVPNCCSAGAAESCYVKAATDGGREVWKSMTTLPEADDFHARGFAECDNTLYQEVIAAPICADGGAGAAGMAGGGT